MCHYYVGQVLVSVFFFFFKCIDSILICEFMLLSCEYYLLSGVDGAMWCGVRVGIFELGK